MMWVSILALAVFVYVSANMLLYGVSEWWKANVSPDEETRKRKKRNAVALICLALFIWSFVTIWVVNASTLLVVLQILQAAGVDISALTQGAL